MGNVVTELSVTIVAAITAFASVVGAATYSWRKWFRPSIRGLHEGWRKVQAASHLIEAQLTTNGGTSLLDRVHRIDVGLAHCPLFIAGGGDCPIHGRDDAETELR